MALARNLLSSSKISFSSFFVDLRHNWWIFYDFYYSLTRITTFHFRAQIHSHLPHKASQPLATARNFLSQFCKKKCKNRRDIWEFHKFFVLLLFFDSVWCQKSEWIIKKKIYLNEKRRLDENTKAVRAELSDLTWRKNRLFRFFVVSFSPNARTTLLSLFFVFFHIFVRRWFFFEKRSQTVFPFLSRWQRM